MESTQTSQLAGIHQLFVILLLFSCSAFTRSGIADAGENASAISAAAVREHIQFLADPKREGRSGAGKIQAREYIVSQMRAQGLQPLFAGSWTQPVPSRKAIDGEDIPAGENIGGFVPGTDPQLKDEWIVVNAHYDHLGKRRGKVYPGADDNASGVSMVIEVAGHLAKHPTRRSVAFVCFDFEESMLWGSRWFMGHTPMDVTQIKMCITADMIGRSLGGLGLDTVFLMGAEHSGLVRQAIGTNPVPEHLELAQLGADMIGTRSDYGPFRDQEIPFLFFSTGEHPDYHTPSDTSDKIDDEKVGRISSFILDLVTQLGNSQSAIRWEPPEYQKIEEARAIYRVADQLLASEAAGKIALTSVQRFFVSQVHSKTAFMIREQRVSDEERKWITRTAQMMLITIF
jgi:hypothetical protein